MANPELMKQKNIIDVIKYRPLWLSISAILLIPCFCAIVYLMATQSNHAPVKLGIDYTGGTILQYATQEDVSVDSVNKIRKDLQSDGFLTPVVQTINNQTGVQTETEKKTEETSQNNEENNSANNAVSDDNSKEAANTVQKENKPAPKTIISIKTSFLGDNKGEGIDKVENIVKNTVSDAELVQTNSVGPSLGAELLKNSLIALCLAFVGIVVYISFRFQAAYAIIALLALAHDAIFVIGFFAIMGIFFDWYADSLFITAVLTVIGFSVHDTIVVFDRVRENNRFLAKKYTTDEIINASVNQTLARSVNTSITTLVTLLALYVFGGTTTRDFVLAMILGIAIGTYSSIFFASVLLAWEKEIVGAKKAKA